MYIHSIPTIVFQNEFSSSNLVDAETATKTAIKDNFRKRIFSSLGGDANKLAISTKVMELHQYSKLMSFCKRNNIHLNEDLAEKGN